MVIAVGVSEEVAAQRREVRAGSMLAFVHRLEVVRQRAEARLEYEREI